ncbi:MORC family CW-type zinc finger protein 1 [Pituophis catenifer annectens]|uniref:MORC family CW-type zinc finger protein 1 n=1 Tax=Pituophis catenifer annectens TaxID=94852 RepID=UPI00399664F0
MAESALYAGLCRAELTLEFLHANSTTHDFVFGAIAELIDNSRDAGATRLDIYTVNNDNLQGGFILCFLDDGCGMSPYEATDIVYFGRSSKRKDPKMIGRYGNGLKSGSMRIGNDLILFTKKENTMTCLLFSQTFCETEGLSEVIVPILSWSSDTRTPVIDDPEKFPTQLSIICKYSPFNNEDELMKQFNAIYGKTGTLLVIYNLKLALNGEPELDILTDEKDILTDRISENYPEEKSLRAYTAILYLNPRMRIFIQAEKVQTKHLLFCFYRPRMYPYISSSFKQIATRELQKAQMELKAAENAVADVKGRLKQLSLSEDSEYLQVVLREALEEEKTVREKNEEKKRNLRRPKRLFIIFGINIQNRSQDGMLIYSNNRLIRMFEKLGSQKNVGPFFSAGAVGIIDVPLDVMEPTHNKQAFANIKEYRHLLKSMEHYLIQYWKDMGISQKGEKFWNDFGYLSDKWYEKPSETVQYKRRRAAEIPYIVQCDVCLKWRFLSLNTDIDNEVHHDIWNCGRSSNSLENKCSIPENLPRIPLGTFNPTHLNDKEKLLIDSIQRNKRKVEKLQLRLIQPHKFSKHTDDSKTPAKDNVCQKTFCKDSPQAYRHPAMKNASKGYMPQSNYRKRALARQTACSQRRCSFYQDEKKSTVVDRKDHSMPKMPPSVHFEKLYYGEPELKIESENKPEIIYIVSSDSETEDLPKDELFAGCALMKKEKQEQCEETADSFLGLHKHGKSKKRHMLSANSKRSTEATKEDKDQVFIVEEKSVEVSHLTENSQSITKAKMIQTLTSRIKEILLYFLPECDKSREHIASMCPEDVLSMFKLKRHWDHSKTVVLSIDQYFSQYERQLSKKLQRQEEHCFQKVYAIEKQIHLRKEQVKATQKKLEHLRRNIAILLSRMNPNLVINNLEHVDTILEECLNQEITHPLVPITTNFRHK